MAPRRVSDGVGGAPPTDSKAFIQYVTGRALSGAIDEGETLSQERLEADVATLEWMVMHLLSNQHVPTTIATATELPPPPIVPPSPLVHQHRRPQLRADAHGQMELPGDARAEAQGQLDR